MAFPSISTGIYNYPIDKAAEVAVITVKRFMDEFPDEIDIVYWGVDDRTFAAYRDEISKLY